jgi:hypothetical protein
LFNKRLKNGGELQLQKAQLKSILEYPMKLEKRLNIINFKWIFGHKNADYWKTNLQREKGNYFSANFNQQMFSI